MLLKNKTAIVTGCNRGIGKGILGLFAEHGADLFACSRQETPEFSADLAKLAKRTGRIITPVYFDMTHPEQVNKAIKTIMASKRPIDVLVNNAGLASGALFQMSSLPEMRNLFEINFFSQLLFTQGISRLMVRAEKGSIINIASIAGLIGDAGTTSYGASKAALMFATKTIATELGASNIRVNAVAPSVTLTDMYEQMEDKARTKLIEACALKRPAEVREVANVALFLASDMASYITGQVLRVDGGHTS